MPLPKGIADLVAVNRVQGFFSDGSGYCGIRKRGLIVWYRWSKEAGGMVPTGSTRTPQGARYVKLVQ